MSQVNRDAPAIVDHLASTLLYCPTEGAFYVKPSEEALWMEAKGELYGEPVCSRKKLTSGKNYKRKSMVIRANPRFNRRAVNAGKLAWYMVHGEWPFMVGYRNGPEDLRICNLHAISTEGEYMVSLGDPLYWENVWKETPPVTTPPVCQVVWYPGMAPGIEEV